MINYKKHIENLNFHDSNIESIKIEDCDYFDRKLTLRINYYNWEGNSEDSDTWTTKTLLLIINHCVNLQMNAPNLMEDTFEIMSEEYDLKYNEFVKRAEEEKKRSYFNHLKSKELKNFLSIKFNTNNFGDSIFNESAGFIWIAGFNVQHEWIEEKVANKKHIAVK